MSTTISEADIQKSIMEYLALIGAVATRINSGVIVTEGADGRARAFRGANKGTSDIIACLPGGKFIAIEVKRPGNKPTEAQSAFLARVREAGGLAMVATSIEDVAREVGYGLPY